MRGNVALVAVDEPTVSEVEEEKGGRARKLGTVPVDDDCSFKMGGLDSSTLGLDAGNAGAVLAALTDIQRACSAAEIGTLSLLEIGLS